MRELKKIARNAYILGKDMDIAQFRTSNNEIIDVKVSSGRVSAGTEELVPMTERLAQMMAMQDALWMAAQRISAKLLALFSIRGGRVVVRQVG